MSVYSSGSVTVKVGSQAVVGASTLFTSYASAGDVFKVTSEGVYYTIAAVNTATNISLSANYANANYGAGTSLPGQPYQIIKDFTANYSIPEANPSDQNVEYIYTKGVRTIDAALYNASVHSIKVASFAIKLGSVYLWADNSNVLRIKAGVPTSKTDGTIVGSQS